MHFNGDADALYGMGCAYEDADDVKHDSAAAAVCFRTAAEKGHADAHKRTPSKKPLRGVLRPFRKSSFGEHILKMGKK